MSSVTDSDRLVSWGVLPLGLHDFLWFFFRGRLCTVCVLSNSSDATSRADLGCATHCARVCVCARAHVCVCSNYLFLKSYSRPTSDPFLTGQDVSILM
uniref:Uncharacterized protein n=1 Tax=Anguilla anguilla TaxID=7936 RepID=A0A0E9WQ23_ANGAN